MPKCFAANQVNADVVVLTDISVCDPGPPFAFVLRHGHSMSPNELIAKRTVVLDL